MNQQANDFPNDRDHEFPWWLFEMADWRFRARCELVGAKVSEMAVAYALFETYGLSIPILVMLDIQQHFRFGQCGKVERISICDADLTHGQQLDVLPSQQLARRIERHLSIYRPLLLADGSCSRLFPAPVGASAIDFTLRRRRGLFELCLMQDEISRLLSSSPVSASAIDFSLRRCTVLFRLCMAL